MFRALALRPEWMTVKTYFAGYVTLVEDLSDSSPTELPKFKCHTSSEKWTYIPTDDNPADFTTRHMTPTKLAYP